MLAHGRKITVCGEKWQWRVDKRKGTHSCSDAECGGRDWLNVIIRRCDGQIFIKHTVDAKETITPKTVQKIIETSYKKN